VIPGSLDPGESLDIKESLRSFKAWIRRYFWLWIAYQTVKGVFTTTVIWVPLVYMLWTK
jgi:hypothetical protein